jgi:hypothetical protein
MGPAKRRKGLPSLPTITERGKGSISRAARKRLQKVRKAQSLTDAQQLWRQQTNGALQRLAVFHTPAYFEKQTAQHCQVHAVNNALGARLLTALVIEKARKLHQRRYRQKPQEQLEDANIPAVSRLAPVEWGGLNGHWPRHIVFTSLGSVGITIHRVPFAREQRTPQFFHDLAQKRSRGGYVLYTEYDTKFLQKSGRAVLYRQKHCIALRDAHVLDSLLCPKAIPVAAYPFFADVTEVYELCGPGTGANCRQGSLSRVVPGPQAKTKSGDERSMVAMRAVSTAKGAKRS